MGTATRKEIKRVRKKREKQGEEKKKKKKFVQYSFHWKKHQIELDWKENSREEEEKIVERRQREEN